jgi:hypothetical protein
MCGHSRSVRSLKPIGVPLLAERVPAKESISLIIAVGASNRLAPVVSENSNALWDHHLPYAFLLRNLPPSLIVAVGIGSSALG